MKLEQIYPINDKIVVIPEKVEDEQVSEGGIILPDTISTGGLLKGKVIETSNGMFSTHGNLIPLVIVKSDTVLYNKQNSGQEYNLNGTDVLIMSQNDVVSVISEREEA
tara:strand:+ start:351 stop:674 length:324 start_codon:yes stop_codon:yes gene_type:complete